MVLVTTLKNTALANKTLPLQVEEKKSLNSLLQCLLSFFPFLVFLILDVWGNVYVCFSQMAFRHFADYFIMSCRSPMLLRQ